MKLKVVKYKNYGCMLESGENEDLPTPEKSSTTRIFFMPLNIGN